MIKNGKIIWDQDIKKNEKKTDNGFVIETILKNKKVIYNIDKNERYNYASIIRNFSDYNKTNEIIVIFTKKYFQGSIGEETRNDLVMEIYIKNNYFYDKELNITKYLNSRIEDVYVKKGFEGTNLYSIF